MAGIINITFTPEAKSSGSTSLEAKSTSSAALETKPSGSSTKEGKPQRGARFGFGIFSTSRFGQTTVWTNEEKTAEGFTKEPKP